MHCAGDSTTKFGSGWRNSAYEITTTSIFYSNSDEPIIIVVKYVTPIIAAIIIIISIFFIITKCKKKKNEIQTNNSRATNHLSENIQNQVIYTVNSS
jgi:uncharacterized membrane protein